MHSFSWRSIDDGRVDVARFPMAGSTRTAAWAYTSTTSLPVTNRAMSKSWIIMSRKMPPDTSMYEIGGGAGSRLVMRTMCRSPTEPSITAERTEACAASNRRLKPTWNGTPLDSITANASSTLPRSSEIGFSQKMALPACAAAIMNGTCVSVLLQIATASTSADESTAPTSVV